MSRFKIADLFALRHLLTRPLPATRGAGPRRVQLELEMLETRDLMSGLISTLPVSAPPTNYSYQVQAGTLREQIGVTTRVVDTNVVSYQAIDANTAAVLETGNVLKYWDQSGLHLVDDNVVDYKTNSKGGVVALDRSGNLVVYTPRAGTVTLGTGIASFSFRSDGAIVAVTIKGGVRTYAAGDGRDNGGGYLFAPILGELSVTQWTAGQSGYSGTIAISGGSGSFYPPSVSGPSWLVATLTGRTITLTGTPPSGATGSVTVSLTVTDVTSSSTTAAYNLTINAPPTLSELNGPQLASSQSSYTGTITISGGTPTYSSLAVTGLPQGLSSTLVGNTITLSGTLAQTGTFNIGVSVQDRAGTKVTKTYSLTVNAPLAPVTLGDLTRTVWTVSQSGYSATVAVSGGSGSYTALTVVGQPQGLSATLAGNTITLSGTPAQAGAFSVTVSVQDTKGTKVTKTYSLTINGAPTLGTLSVGQWGQNQSGYAATIAVSGGTPGYSNLTVTGLPQGVTFALAGGTITLSGTPTQNGTFSVGVSVADTTGAKATKTYTLTITAPAVVYAPVTLGNLSVTQWTVGQPGYAATIAVTGGNGNYSNLTVAGLPQGVSYSLAGNTITLSGTPSQSGTFNVGVSIKDTTGASASRTFAVTVVAAKNLTLTPTLPVETAGQYYAVQVGATGGSGNYRFALASGALPPGLMLSSTGVLSGVSTVAGTYQFSIRATDNVIAGLTATQTYTLVVNPAAVASVVVQAPTRTVVNTSNIITITARDQFGNLVNGLVTLTSSDGTVNTTLNLVNGTASVPVVFKRAGTFTLTTTMGGVTTTNTIVVNRLPTVGPVVPIYSVI